MIPPVCNYGLMDGDVMGSMGMDSGLKRGCLSQGSLGKTTGGDSTWEQKHLFYLSFSSWEAGGVQGSFSGIDIMTGGPGVFASEARSYGWWVSHFFFHGREGSN